MATGYQNLSGNEYQNAGIGMTQRIAQIKARQEQRFFGSLLEYGMASGGSFDVENGVPNFYGGTPLPSKSVLWNNYLKMKGGRLSPMDVQKFEYAYEQAKSIGTQRNLQEIQKLQLQGISDKQVSKTIKDSPQLYNNMLDMITQLEGSGNEEAYRQAQVVKTYLPDITPPMLSRLVESGKDNILLSTALAYGGYKAAQLLPKDKGPLKWLRDKTKFEKVPSRAAVSRAEGYVPRTEAGKKAFEKVAPKFTGGARKAAQLRNLAKVTPGVGTALMGQAVQPGVGKAIGGETGEQIGGVIGGGLLSAAGVRGLLSLTSKTPWLPAKVAGYAGLGLFGLYDMFNKATGDEE